MDGYLNLLGLVTPHGQSKELVPVIRENEAFGPWWYNITDVVNVSNPSLAPGNQFPNIHWPVVLSIGWWDIFQGPSFRALHGLYDRRLGDPAVRDKHVVIVDPLGHCFIGLTPGFAHSNLHRETINGIAVAAELASEFFKGETNGTMRSRIGRLNYFVMSDFGGDARKTPGNYWTSLETYPPSTERTFYMQAGRKLSDSPASSASSVAYTYDPSTKAGVTPMVGGNNLPIVGHLPVCGTADQTKREKRDDVVVFASGVLSDDLPVVGQIFATLFVSSSAKDTDFVVTISDLGPRKSMLVRYGAVRMRWRSGGAKGNYLEPSTPLVNGTVYKVEVDLWSTAYIFPKGHRVRVAISSAASPYYHANPNTGSPESASVAPSKFKPVAASNIVHFAPEYPSRISLPTVKLEDIPRNPKFHARLPQAAEAADLIV
jgi:putative CocE/NonD family hydrolase